MVFLVGGGTFSRAGESKRFSNKKLLFTLLFALNTCLVFDIGDNFEKFKKSFFINAWINYIFIFKNY